MGIKHEVRLVVFYHQGNINDAWKTSRRNDLPLRGK